MQNSLSIPSLCMPATGRFVALGSLLRQVSVRNLRHLRAKGKMEHDEQGLPESHSECVRIQFPMIVSIPDLCLHQYSCL